MSMRHSTARWAKIEITFNERGADIKTDATGGENQSFMDHPTRQLQAHDDVLIRVPQGSHGKGFESISNASASEIGFYLRLKKTPGCTSKLSEDGNFMHLYIRPNSDAAKFFVQRMIPKLVGKRPANEIEAYREKLLPP